MEDEPLHCPSLTPHPQLPSSRPEVSPPRLGSNTFFLPTVLSLSPFDSVGKKKKEKKKTQQKTSPPASTTAGRNLTWQRAQVSALPHVVLCQALRGQTGGPCEDGTPTLSTEAQRSSLPQFPFWEGSRAAPRVSSAPHIPPQPETICLFLMENLSTGVTLAERFWS